MKKILTLVIITILGFNVKAQTSLTEAVDFTGTDCYGEEVVNLFEILDRGQHVLIDFYYYQCTPCQRVVPYVVEAYEAFGCNNHDVFFMEVSHYDNDELCQWWAEKYGVQYPTISREGGGIEIQQAYEPRQYPTLVLIAPDRKILLQDINYDSIKARESQYIIEQLEQFGIKQHGCDEPVIEAGTSVVNLDVEIMSNTSVYITATPNEETVEYHYILIEKTYSDSIGIDSTMNILHADTNALYEVNEWEWLDLKPKTKYYAIAQGKNADGIWGDTTQVQFYTSLDGNIEIIENKFNIHPNPASSYINIKSEMSGKGEVNIYDMTGRCVKNVIVSDLSDAIIDLSDIEKGIYLINVNGKKEKVVVLN